MAASPPRTRLRRRGAVIWRNDWRNGPAKLWYDRLGLPEDCQQYDYGMKPCSEPSVTSTQNLVDSEDAFHLVSQIKWERNVIWDPEAVKQKVMRTVDKPSIAGWIPIEGKRTAPQFLRQIDGNVIKKLVANDMIHNEVINNCNKDSKCDKSKDNTINGLSKKSRKRRTEICDNDNEITSKKIPEVETQWVSTLHEENRQLVSNLWEEDIIWDPTAMHRIPDPKIIPFNDDDNAIIEWNDFDENSSDSNSNHNSMADSIRQLSLNISNDEFYASVTKADNSTSHSLLITHSVPAIELNPLCFPSWDPDFFRPTLKRSRKLHPRVEHSVIVCKQINCLSFKAQNSTDLSKYLIKNISELSARSGHIVLMEYSEESPPLVMRVGMGSQIFNYFNKTKGKNYCPEEHRFAQTKAVTNSPFIGEIKAGKSQLALETNMFRSPIWEHTCPHTDFLVIRTEENYYIREIDGLFAVGQTLPLMEVPSFRSKAYSNLAKQFAKMFIYRYLNGRKSVLNLDKELLNAFPNLNKHFLLQTILKEFTKRLTNDRFVLKSEIPFDNQINTLLTPENICAYYSSAITVATTLKKIGFGDRLILNDEDNEQENRLNEMSFLPWNTTTAFIGSVNSRKMLNVNDYNLDGSLTYVNQSYKQFKDQMPAMRRCLPLSDLSIKRITTLKRAHNWLIDYGMSRNEIRRYKNVNECRELIKDLSDVLRESGVTAGMSKTRSTLEYYKLQCQKIFDLHSRFYSKQNYETDESEDEEEEEESDTDIEEMGDVLEAMIVENKSLEQIQNEREEKVRKEWLKEIRGQNDPKSKETKRSFKGKVLKIKRTYDNMDGTTYTRLEIVRIPKVIETYVRIRETKTDDFIRQLSFVKDHKESGQTNTKTKSKNISVNSVNKTTKTPKTVNGVLKTVSENVSNIRNGFVNNSAKDFDDIDVNDDNWDINETDVEENESLVLIDGSKLKFSKKVVLEAKQIEAEDQRRIQLEKEEEERSKTVSYFVTRSSSRQRIDPMVRLKDIFDRTIVEVRKREELDENIEWFLEPIRVKDVPDYYDVIKNPMDLKTIRQNISRGFYSSREEFLKDVKLIYDNCLEYNGDNEITTDALKLFQFCKERLDSMDDRLGPLEKMYVEQRRTLNGRVS